MTVLSSLQSLFSKKKKEYREKNKDNVRNLWENFKHTNISIVGMLEGEVREQEFRSLLQQIIAENFLNLVKEIHIQVQKAQIVPNKMYANRSTPRHNTIKMSKVKDKERILKAAREKQLVTYKGVPIRLLADFSDISKSLLCHNSYIFSFAWQHLHFCLAHTHSTVGHFMGTSQTVFLNAQAMYLLCILKSLSTFPFETSKTLVIIQCLFYLLFFVTILLYSSMKLNTCIDLKTVIALKVLNNSFNLKNF